MFARVEIAVESAMALAVPQESLVFRGGENAVFVVGDATVSLRPVATGTRRDGWVEITEGMVPGERVAVDGAGFLKDGDVVRVELAQSSGVDAEDAE